MAMAITKSLSFPFQIHKAQWQACKLCALCQSRSQVVYYRGTLPCKVLFLVEAPDMASDQWGEPLPSNDPASDGAIFNLLTPEVPTWCLTTCVGCFPSVDMKPEFMEACFPKLLNFIGLAKPKVIVAVGKGVEKHVHNHLGAIITKLNQQVALIHIPAPFWFKKQKDPDLELERYRLQVVTTCRKYC